MFYHDNNLYINFLLIVPASKVSPAHSRRARRYKQYVPGNPCSLSPELFPKIPEHAPLFLNHSMDMVGWDPRTFHHHFIKHLFAS